MHQKHLRLNVPKGEAKWEDDPMETVVSSALGKERESKH